MNSKLRIAVHGAGGRMGCRVVDLVLRDSSLSLAGAWEQSTHPAFGADSGITAGSTTSGVAISLPWQSSPPSQVVIDFSVPEAAIAIVESCRDHNVPIVVATTGFDDPQKERIRAAGQVIPIVWAPSMSLAVNITMKLAEIAARAWGQQPQQVDVEILERHHRFKEDAPSGTALRFGEIIADVMGQTLHRHGREGRVGQRPGHEIGYHAIRVADNPGEHTIVFAVPGETIELTVRSSSRDAYAEGAIAAAKYVAHRSPGIYSMWDVLGMDS